MATLFESTKQFIFGNKDKQLSSEVEPINIKNNLSDDENGSFGAFFDSGSNSQLGYADKETLLSKQAAKIQKYRCVALESDVADAIDNIINEIIFSYDNREPVQIIFELDNEALQKKINESFNKIMRLINVDKNLYNIVKTGYIDGQLIYHLGYEKENTKKGIQEIKLIDPIMFYWNNEDNNYQYSERKHFMHNNFLTLYSQMLDPESVKYTKEEIVRDDFGLHNDYINLSYLEYALKPANMLQTLEDLLIPLRFSRSISRRVFNVDIGDLPTKRGKEVMTEYQRKFQYKKFYNNQTGEISNQQHITSMVEDYWFANRSGGRGTTVDTLDETGNLGELDDIIYFSKKLYRSLKIPSSRSPYSDDVPEFDFDTTRVTQEDMAFFMFVSRLRKVYTNTFKEILKREVISTNIVSENEWNDIEKDIIIRFTSENAFIEKMKTSNLLEQIATFESFKEVQGKLFSIETILKYSFRYSDEQIEEEMKKIEEEKNNKKFKNFYETNDEEY